MKQPLKKLPTLVVGLFAAMTLLAQVDVANHTYSTGYYVGWASSNNQLEEVHREKVKNEKAMPLNVQSYSNGIYNYHLIKNGEVVEVGRFIISR